MNSIAYIGLGSNIEPRLARLRSALIELSNLGIVEAESKVYETVPIGYIHQDPFLNSVISLTTNLTAFELHRMMKKIEDKLGRASRPRWHKREIDLDLLFFNSEIISSGQLSIPHPEIQHRGFVLIPLSDINANFIHPVNLKTISELLMDLGDLSSSVHVYLP